jgi:hypothetical protein
LGDHRRGFFFGSRQQGATFLVCLLFNLAQQRI